MSANDACGCGHRWAIHFEGDDDYYPGCRFDSHCPCSLTKPPFEPTPATPAAPCCTYYSKCPAHAAAPGGEVELLERAAKLLDICNHGETVGRLSPTRALREDVETWLRDYRRPREGK